MRDEAASVDPETFATIRYYSKRPHGIAGQPYFVWSNTESDHCIAFDPRLFDDKIISVAPAQPKWPTDDYRLKRHEKRTKTAVL